MVKKRRWLLAAAVLPLILAACTSATGRQGPGTGTAAGSSSAAPGGLRAVRHVWVIELENQGYAQSFGTPSADPYLATTLPRTGALLENYYAIGHSSATNYIAQVSGQARTSPPRSTAALDTFPRPGHRRAVPPVPRRGLRLPGGSPDARQPAVRRAQLGRVPAGHGQRPRPGPHGRHRAGPPAATPPPGPSTTPRKPRKATSTPPATTGSPSSGRSPPARPFAPRTSCRSGRCRATWPGPPPAVARPPASARRTRTCPCPGRPVPAAAASAGSCCPAHQARYRQRRSVQPLLAAALDRGHLRPAAPGRRGHAAGQVLRPRHIRLRKGRS
jgi:hypothetical protein